MPFSNGQSGNPVLVAHFLVAVGAHDIPLHSVSALHAVLGESGNSDHRQFIVLKRAVTTDKFLFHWYRDTRLGKDTATNVTISQLRAPGVDVVNTWVVENARPVRWTGPRFDALSSDLAMGELQLQYDSIIWRDA